MKLKDFAYYSRYHYKKGWTVNKSKLYCSGQFSSKNITDSYIKCPRNERKIFQLLRVVYVALHEIFNRVPSLSYIAIDRDDPVSKIIYAPYVSKKIWRF